MLKKKLLLVPDFLFRPRHAYAEVQQSPELDFSLLVLVVTAVVSIKDTWLSHDFDTELLMIVLAFIGAIIGTILSAVLYAHLLGWIASLFKKGDDANKLRLAIPYCFLPIILGNLITLMVSNDRMDMVIRIVCAIWAYAIAAILVSEVKGMALVKAIFTMLISNLVLLIPFGLVYFFVKH